MPLCDESLLDRLHTCQRRGLPGLPRDELLGYMDEVAGAIDFLNEPRHPSDDGGLVGVQHRDIKPQNRVVERHPARFWAYWKSLDFRTNRRRRTCSRTRRRSSVDAIHISLALSRARNSVARSGPVSARAA